MAATGKAASKKGELASFNLGDEGFYEDDGAGLDVDYYYSQMKSDELKEKNKVYKREPSAKEIKEKQDAEEFEQRKAKGLLHLAPDKLALMAAEEERLKAKRKAERMKLLEEEDKRAQLEAQRLAKLQARRYKRSSAYKRKCWEQKQQVRMKHDTAWEAAEKQHRDLEEEYRAAKELYDRQRRIDESWQPKKEAKPEAAAKAAKPQPKPKGKKGKAVDLSKYAGMLPPAALKRQQEGEDNPPLDENLPWDPEKGEKDPNRPAPEKKAEETAWERRQRAWKKHLEEYGKVKQDHLKEVQRMKEEGLYESEPEFHTDPDTDGERSGTDDESD